MSKRRYTRKHIIAELRAEIAYDEARTEDQSLTERERFVSEGCAIGMQYALRMLEAELEVEK